VALRGEAVADASARIVGGQPEVGAVVELTGVTMLETLFEVSMATAISLVPGLLEMEFPATARIAMWEWTTGRAGAADSTARLGELRIGCRRGASRVSWPVASVFDGDPTVGHALRAAGISGEEGSCQLAVYHDVVVASFTGSSGEVCIKLRTGAEVHPAGLQWNIAPLLCILNTADSGLARSPVQHQFASLRTGQPSLTTAGLLGPGLGQAVGGLLARGDVIVGPVQEIGMPGVRP
jgi:hypothetical protein